MICIKCETSFLKSEGSCPRCGFAEEIKIEEPKIKEAPEKEPCIEPEPIIDDEPEIVKPIAKKIAKKK